MNNKSLSYNKNEYIALVCIILFIIINAIIKQDSEIAVISAICGITYTFIAGKGNPICYLFGVTGSAFYSYLALQNHLWGQLILYLLYYIPMQITGYFKWTKHLKKDSNEIVKINLPYKELFILLIILIIGIIFSYFILVNCNDKHPLLDSITTVVSFGGMYLTVRRAIEQWILWFVVNVLSFAMWLSVLLNGAQVCSTVIMWGVYSFLAVYFYLCWKKEIDQNIKK